MSRKSQSRHVWEVIFKDGTRVIVSSRGRKHAQAKAVAQVGQSLQDVWRYRRAGAKNY